MQSERKSGERNFSTPSLQGAKDITFVEMANLEMLPLGVSVCGAIFSVGQA